VSSVTESGTRSSGRRIGALILGIIGILLVILAIIYLTTAAGSLPSFIPGHMNGSSGHHPLRIGVALVVGLALIAGAWWLGFAGRKSGAGTPSSTD
jgi:H+/Cl- antiporter ClcA